MEGRIGSGDGDLGQLLLGLRQLGDLEHQHPVLHLGRDAGAVGAGGQLERAGERARPPLDTAPLAGLALLLGLLLALAGDGEEALGRQVDLWLVA